MKYLSKNKLFIKLKHLAFRKISNQNTIANNHLQPQQHGEERLYTVSASLQLHEPNITKVPSYDEASKGARKSSLPEYHETVLKD